MSLQLATTNLLSPAVLCFALGAFAVLVRSDLRLPEPVFTGLSIYLMLSIGLRGGAEMSDHPLTDVAGPIAAALLLGCAIPVWCYALLRRWGGFSVADAAALAAHYGSVSAVTFAAVTALLDRQGTPFEGYAAALLSVMEVPAIVVALGLARLAIVSDGTLLAEAGGALVIGPGPGSMAGLGRWSVLSEVMSSKSVVLLTGGVVIGMLAGPVGLAKVKPFFADLFQGALCLFLLDLGRVAASRIRGFRQVGVFLGAFAMLMPVLHALLGILLARAIGLTEGGAIVLGTLAASASYIAAPAAVRLALPEANPCYYLTSSLAITFPFNIVIGIPLYAALAAALYR